jgi:hypothetical protein
MCLLALDSHASSAQDGPPTSTVIVDVTDRHQVIQGSA